jgi:hypothetical protein
VLIEFCTKGEKKKKLRFFGLKKLLFEGVAKATHEKRAAFSTKKIIFSTKINI